MHGHAHFWGGPRAFWAMAGRAGREGFGPFGHGSRGGGRGGGRDFLRAGRMLGDGELRLIALTLIEEQPRHGYDIIRALEERTSGFYSPSPGVVYPTLTYLEEAGYATSATEGSKKVFSITEAGKAHLAENRAAIVHVLERLEHFGRKMARAREWFDWRDDEERSDRRGDQSPESWRRLNIVRRRLRASLADALSADADKRARAIDILEQAADALEELFRR